jgi:hypothetical protein
LLWAGVAELADAADLKSAGEILVGSSPSPGTTYSSDFTVSLLKLHCVPAYTRIASRPVPLFYNIKSEPQRVF